MVGLPSHAGTGRAQTRAHSAAVTSGCVSTGSPGMFKRYCRNGLAARSLDSAAACSRSSVRRRMRIDRADRIHPQHFVEVSPLLVVGLQQRDVPPVAELPAATNDGHHDAGPVVGAGASVPTATTVVRRFPSAVVIASHNLRPAVGPHAPGSSATISRTFAPSPSARFASLEITRTRVRVLLCVTTPSFDQRYSSDSPSAARVKSNTIAAWLRDALTNTFSTAGSNSGSPGVSARATN